MDYDKPIMENLHHHAFNYRNAHSTQASNDFNTLEEFVSNLGIAAGEKWREEWSEVCNENQVLINRNQALLEALKKTVTAIDLLTDKVDGTGFSYSHEFQNALDEMDIARAAIKLAEWQDV